MSQTSVRRLFWALGRPAATRESTHNFLIDESQ
jgi:hypothetical protein